MSSPFPGMDPWLEHPDVFPDVHDSLNACIREALNVLLPAPYFANIATRVWVEVSERMIGPDVKIHRPFDDPSSASASSGGTAVAEAPATEGVVVLVPHDEIREPFIEIHSGDRQRLVTSIEVLSLSNKRPGEHGRELYLKKQKEVLESQVHLVEIDLLRGGEHTTAVSRPWAEKKVGVFDYHVCVHHFDRWAEYVVFAWRLDMKLPAIVIPLLPGDPPVRLELQPLLDRVYDSGRYHQQLRYRATMPEPPLTPPQRVWVESILTDKGL